MQEIDHGWRSGLCPLESGVDWKLVGRRGSVGWCPRSITHNPNIYPSITLLYILICPYITLTYTLIYSPELT